MNARNFFLVVDAHTGPKLIQEMAALPPGGEPQVPGELAVFDYDDVFAFQRQPLRSELYVFCYVGGNWAFEYRFTSPRSPDASGVISTFMAALTWTVPSQ